MIGYSYVPQLCLCVLEGAVRNCVTRCSGNIVFFHNSLQPLPRLHHRCKRPSKLSNAIRVYSHSYWLEIFCTTNSSRVLARERWQIFENSWKKTQYLMNTLYYKLPSLFRRIIHCIFLGVFLRNNIVNKGLVKTWRCEQCFGCYCHT